MKTKEKLKAVLAAIAGIEKQFGKGAIMPLDGKTRTEVDVIPTGSLGLDIALGVGGLPRGRVIEIFGPESSGKTTLTLHAIAEAQRLGGTCAFIDAEHAFDPNYARRLGVKLDELWVSQPDHGEQALEIADQLTRSGGVDLIVIDSVAALTPKAEIEGDMGDSHMGLQARLMSQALRKLTAVAFKQNTTLIFINQLRQKIGIVFGNPETTTGGNALKFYASVRLDIRKTGMIKEGETSVANRVKVKVIKNKCAPPFRQTEFEVLYGLGINTAAELVDLATTHGLVEKSGASFMLDGERIGQGRDNVCVFLREHPEIAESLRERLLSAMKTAEPQLATPEPEEVDEEDLVEAAA
jgi:recombination protein RecA